MLRASDPEAVSQGQRLRSALFMDVSSATKDPSNPGVIRVTRRLGRELQDRGEDPFFVVWEDQLQSYVLPTDAECAILGCFNGPSITQPDRRSESLEQRRTIEELLDPKRNFKPWLLLPEVMMETSFQGARRFARAHQFSVAAIFYDSIPVLRPDLCNEEIRNNHGHYMTGLAECDLVLPISHFSDLCLRRFWNDRCSNVTCEVVTDVLPGEFGGAVRSRTPSDAPLNPTRMLCVSTLEPRKNHKTLIRACLRMQHNHPELDWSLTLVGGRYHGSSEIAVWIEEIAAHNSRIRWLGVVDDSTLERLYRESSFTIYPSVIEGFGLPILESLWHGRPCLCHNQGVMAELAAGGGCLTADVTDLEVLGDAIVRLGADRELRRRLSAEAVSRPLRTWHDYVVELTTALVNLTQPANLWNEVLYPDCGWQSWQMNGSERMALTGLLGRHKPYCSIEVNSLHDGSLTLVSQYSGMVFSIDVDYSLSSRDPSLNVSSFYGPSSFVLSLLLQELDNASIPADFILIHANRSAAGVVSEIACLLDYVPRSPLFVALHGSFNPECRRRLLEANWERSLYCHSIEIDFVPGRISETAEPLKGELQGGLALAYFLPVARSGKLQLSRAAERSFQVLAAEEPLRATTKP